MSEKSVLYLAGGGMSGIFGAGIVAALERADSYDDFEAIYGASAGAFNAAYFLAHQTELGASIYLEEMRHDFLTPRDLWGGAIQRLWRGPIFPVHPDRYINAMHLDYVADVVGRTKALDVERVRSSDIPLGIKVFNQHNHRVEYLTFQRMADPLKGLLASAALPPYTFEFELLHHNRMIDSCLTEVIGLSELRHRHPGQKIVIAVNRRPKRTATNLLISYLEAVVGSAMYGRRYYSYPIERERVFREEYEQAEALSDVLLVAPPEESEVTTGTTELHKLEETFRMGVSAADEILAFVR